MVINIQEVVDGFRKIGIELVPNTVNVSIPNAADVLRRGVAFFVGEMYKWLPEYEKVAQWLKNNQNRGFYVMAAAGEVNRLSVARFYLFFSPTITIRLSRL